MFIYVEHSTNPSSIWIDTAVDVKRDPDTAREIYRSPK